MNQSQPVSSVRPPAACHILPPHILRNIAQSGDDDQRARALQTMSIDSTERAQRAAMSAQPYVPQVRVTAAVGVQRTVYTSGQTQTLPGTVARSEGAPSTGDPATDEAYDGLGATYDFYEQAYGRDSVDGNGLPLRGSVHFGTSYDNAFWNGEQMVFGDGDGTLFNRFTISLDVIGHELTHGVTQFDSGLAYLNQPGALNESLSDVFGSLVKQHHLGQTADQADWLIGAELLAPSVHGKALRSMAAPGTAYDDPVLGKDPQPDNQKQYVHTLQDHGGVHINSGIPNHEFYLAATAIGGHAWERAGLIWYSALRDPRIRPTTGFTSFARATLRAAQTIDDGAQVAAVREAWHGVGINV